MGGGCSGLSGDVLLNNTSEVPCFKIVLVGDVQVGKTSVFLRYIKNQFDYSYRPTTTVSIENVVKKLNVPEHTVASISIWDLPGREEVDLRQSYYKDVDAAIVVVDISDPESIDLAGTWRQDILNHAMVSKKQVVKSPEGPRISMEYERADPSQIPVLLLGNKFDIVEEKLAMLNPPLRENGEPESENPEFRDTNGGDGTEQSLKMDKIDTELNNEGADCEVQGENIRGGDEEGSEGDIWKYEEERVNEEKPAEVLQLEACCEQHGFVGSVAVSAKESDGGIHVAMQALVRHLLEHRLRYKAIQKMKAVQVKRSKQKRRKPKKAEADNFRSLEVTKVPALDKLFFQCNPHLSLVHEANLAYQISIRHFKQLCVDMEIVRGPKCSIEDCIEGTRQALKEEELELVLQMELLMGEISQIHDTVVNKKDKPKRLQKRDISDGSRAQDTLPGGGAGPLPVPSNSNDCARGSLNCQYAMPSDCIVCPPGPQGMQGVLGGTGLAGRDGRDGRDGIQGTKGDKGEMATMIDDNSQANKVQQSSQLLDVLSQNVSGVTYVRWGRTVCPDGAEVVYTGFMGGGHRDVKGSGNNYMCLPSVPIYSFPNAGFDSAARIYGTEYEVDDFPQLRNLGVDNMEALCVVCLAPSRTTAIVIPGRNTCVMENNSRLWYMEYDGYLMSAGSRYQKSEYICVDKEPEARAGSHNNENDSTLYVVENRCSPTRNEGLPCPPYVDGYELTCAVCTL